MQRKFIYLVFIAFTVSYAAFSQETVVWASKVLEVSSETSPLQYSAMQALHRPNFYPRGGESPNAWRPRKDNTEEFIVVAFDKPIKIQQVAIAETENPGAVKAVYAYDKTNREYLLFTLTPRVLPIEQRLLNLFFEMTQYEVSHLKVVLDGTAVPGFNSIDAIGISSSNIPITVLINVAANINEDAQAERLSSNVNSTYRENSPLLSPDGKMLFFSRQYHPANMGGVEDNEDIWVSKLDEKTGEWLPAQNVGPPLNNTGPNFISSISQDNAGNIVFLLGNRYERRGRMSVGVSMSTMTPEGKFTEPVNINIANYYNYSDKVDQFMTKDGKVMLLALEREDSYGDRDLYVSFLQSDKSWSQPKSLGIEVNTADEEAAPFMSDDNKTLYFSSRGFSGQGGLDIFVSKRLDDTWTRWSPPENLGKAANTVGDDTYFNIPSVGKHIYFTRGNKGEDMDIFRFQSEEFFIDPSKLKDPIQIVDVGDEIVLVTIKGRVINSKTGEPISTNVQIERLPDGANMGGTTSEAGTGNYQLKVRTGARYGFMAEKDGFLAVAQNIDLNNTTKAEIIERDLVLTPIEIGESIVINNIFFDFDKAILKTASFSELERILKLLKSDKIKKIEISGHTDSMGDDNYNMTLSKRRATAVYNYFQSNGIAADRMSAVGYGETQPTAPNDTNENMAKNRRVEFKIVE